MSLPTFGLTARDRWCLQTSSGRGVPFYSDERLLVGPALRTLGRVPLDTTRLGGGGVQVHERDPRNENLSGNPSYI